MFIYAGLIQLYPLNNDSKFSLSVTVASFSRLQPFVFRGIRQRHKADEGTCSIQEGRGRTPAAQS